MALKSIFPPSPLSLTRDACVCNDVIGARTDGDYTLDYNFQSEYYGVFSSNHAELATNYFPVILKALPLGRRRAAYPHWGDRTSSHSGPAGMILSGWQNALPDTMGNYSGESCSAAVASRAAPIDFCDGMWARIHLALGGEWQELNCPVT